ncbi:hypothetical protein H8959_007227 [Pygathrix nigripes]
MPLLANLLPISLQNSPLQSFLRPRWPKRAANGSENQARERKEEPGVDFAQDICWLGEGRISVVAVADFPPSTGRSTLARAGLALCGSGGRQFVGHNRTSRVFPPPAERRGPRKNSSAAAP